MNITQYISEVSTYASQISLSTFPNTLWDLYVEYLWNYDSTSWVATIAHSSRVMAVLVSLPIAILAMLDITSYAIARTLGVVDDTKASTSDKATVHVVNGPAINIEGSASFGGGSTFTLVDSDQESMRSRIMQHPQSSTEESAQLQPPMFYAGDEHDLKLSGVGVFSPAASRPPSPTISRHQPDHLIRNKDLRHRAQPLKQDTE